jgi:hypothetical protein
MQDDVALALAVTRQIREKASTLGPEGARSLQQHLEKIERSLADPYAPYALGLDISAQMDAMKKSARIDGQPQPTSQPQPASPAPPVPPPRAQTEQLGQRVGTTLQAVDFVGFVSGLITGTFRAIVDASAAQMREYANLVSSIAHTLEDFTGEYVSVNQARDHLVKDYPRDLALKLPPAGTSDEPRLLPRPERIGESPAWLKKYGLEGEELSEDLVEGPLLDAARKKVGEERVSSLASMVLMGVNRIVVNEGDIRAKIQLHAEAIDVQRAEMVSQQGGFAGRDAGELGQQAQMLVSTLKANAQADASLKADLMGEVRVSFRSEAFPLERFADSAAIQLINQHAKWRSDAPAPTPAAAPAAAPAVVSNSGGAR